MNRYQIALKKTPPITKSPTESVLGLRKYLHLLSVENNIEFCSKYGTCDLDNNIDGLQFFASLISKTAYTNETEKEIYQALADISK
jgi:hypothetical protein